MFRNPRALVALLALMPLLASCDQDHNERQRSVVEVSAVAEYGVFVCGIWDAGSDKIFGTSDDFLPAGHVPVTLKNRSYNEFINAPDYTPYGSFHVEEVEVTWSSTAGTTPLTQLTPFNYQANYDVIIPKDSEVTFNVMVVPFAMKNDAFFANLAPAPRGTGTTVPFSAVANMRFRGHDSGAPDHMVDLEGSVVVEFIGIIVTE